jgi:uncharacterized protein (DUF885 family)
MIMNVLFSTLSLFLLLISCTHPKTVVKQSPLDNFSTMLESYSEERLKFFPFDATQQGDNRYNDVLVNDQTQEFRNSLEVFYKKYLKDLETFKRDSLSENDKISYDIFKFEMDIQLEGLKNDLWAIPFQQFWGLPISMGQLGAGESFQPFKTVKDYENWLRRMASFPAWTDSAIANFREGIKTKVTLPKVLVVKMIKQMNDIVLHDLEKSIFYGPINNFPKDFTSGEKSLLREAYINAIQNDINPSYEKLHAFLKNEYLPKARTTDGISSVPNGKNVYKYLAKSWTTTTKSPNEIYAIGLAEVKRIRSEMERVRKELKFKGDLKAFFNHMKTAKEFFPYNTPEEVINDFKKINKTMSPKLLTMFGKTPKTPFEIKQTEAFRAATSSAEYNQGSADGTRPGIFYVPIVDAKKFSTTSGMESLFLHEAIPGHHYQISLQQENLSLPRFRRFSWYGSYGEGWALYTESLGKELGLYTDPYQYMGALGDEMHRAVRLVVDVAVHMKGMTREKAIKYMMDQEPISLDGATAEIERYMAIPGQALSYKIGSLKIWELRKKYSKKLGNQFSVSAFHDEFLKDGCMPLAVLETKMDEWAKGQTKLIK